MIRYCRGIFARSSRGEDGKLISRVGRGLAGAVAMVFCVAACAAVVGVAPASAVVGQFGGEGQGAGQFAEGPRGLAVDQESGDVYLVDGGNHRLEKWGGEGAFLWASGWGVADGHSEAPQSCTSLCFPGLQGTGGGELGNAEGVAVDNDPLSASHGDVYVFDLGASRVEKFDSSGDFLLAFGHEVNATTHEDVCLAGESCQEGTRGANPGEFEPEGFSTDIAVAPSGSVLVGDRGSRVQEFSPGGAYEGQIALPGVGAIKNLAVDSAGDMYVQGHELPGVRKFDGTGNELGEPRDASGSPGALAVGPAGELFVDDTPNNGDHHLLEFESSGGEVARFDAGSEEEGSRGLAFGEGIGELYTLDFREVRLVSPPSSGPLVVSQSVVELQPTTATLEAILNPENHETTYHVEYGTTVAYGSSTTPTVLPGSAFEDEPVSVALSGLQPRTTYHVRLAASNSAGTTFGADQVFTTLPPALIDSESVSQVTSNSATLAAQINPLGRDTTYRFEYGTTTGYGASVPVPDGDVGSGTVDVALSAPVEGLAPGTVYHYRVVTVNSLGTVDGADHVFRTEAPGVSGLLDGRAWEMVSPPDKHGATLEALSPAGGGLAQAALDGGAVTYEATGPVDSEPAGNRSLLFTQVLSKRGADGWTSRGIATPSEVTAWAPTVFVSEYKLFSGDLSVGLVEPEDASVLSPGAVHWTPYRREAGGGFTPLILAAGLPAGISPQSENTEVFGGASRDLSHIVLSSDLPLLSGVPNNGNHSLYEWFGGSLQVASILPNGKQAAEENEDAALGHQGYGTRRAVSDDGSRIAWSTPGALFVRDTSLGETVRLDVVESGAQGGQGGAVFQTASSDGSKVFFLDGSKLTRNATSAGEKPDLYMCEVGEAAGEPTCTLKDLTVDQNTGEAASVQGNVLGASEDGRYVYFVASGVLAAGATPGGNNLYVQDTVTGARRLVATLSSEDGSDWTPSTSGGASIGVTVRVSANGRYLAFVSQRSLTGYENIDANSGQPDKEVFLYDASANSVVCVSCNPTGARPTGEFDSGAFPGLLVDRSSLHGLLTGHWLAGSIPGWDAGNDSGRSSWYQSDYLSDSGRLFFNAADALVPGDTNGLEDVYEYEPGGVGGCAGPGGCVGLMSSGTSNEESALLDASESGNDVFFLTASRLVPRDTDSELDVYDAHVCSTGSPCLAPGAAPSSPPPCTSGDECRGAGSGLPGVFAAPSSTAVSAGGNLAPAPVVKPAVKSRPVSRARKLADVLRACRKKAKGKRRVSCEARARRLYGKGARAGSAHGAGATKKGQG